jgi:hypothetical protein
MELNKLKAAVSGAVRAKTRDNMMTYDSAHQTHDAAGNQVGVKLGNAFKTHDGRTVDSTGAFLVGELERLDLTMHNPLAAVTWARDIDLREDVTIADEVSSFTLSTYGSAGGLGAGNSIGNGKSWIGKSTDQVSGIGVDIGKIPHELRPWGLELKYTILELESSAKLGRPIDTQKYAGLQLKHQMDIDEQVYIGDLSTGDTGLVNSDLVTNISNLPNGAASSPKWALKTPDEILKDVNAALTSVWAATGWAVMPERLMLPPTQFGYISTAKVSDAGNVSILKYLQDNSILTTSGAGKLTILPLKWLVGAGVGGTLGTPGTDRMVVYTKDMQRVRYPMTLLQRTPIQYDSIYHKTTYFCRLGVVEVVYPETIGYFDGL